MIRLPRGQAAAAVSLQIGALIRGFIIAHKVVQEGGGETVFAVLLPAVKNSSGYILDFIGETAFRGIDIDADAQDGKIQAAVSGIQRAFRQDAGDFPAVQENIVDPFDAGTAGGRFPGLGIRMEKAGRL